MKHYAMKRRLSGSSNGVSSIFAFIAGFVLCFLILKTPSVFSAPRVQPAAKKVAQPDDKFVTAWRHSPETCPQWIAIQRRAGSYIDAYVVGSQKGATSQLSKHLYMLGVRHEAMVKEWHFFNTLDENGNIIESRTVARPLPPLNFSRLRWMHYKAGFPGTEVAEDGIPLVQDLPQNDRLITLDMTVEYLHSDRSAFLAQTLTPHAKIIITIRDPLERALSQYNMNMRNGNKKRRLQGLKDAPATADEFDKKVREEIEKIKRCGYDVQEATLDRKTSELVACLFHESNREHFDDALYVTRGLYHVHIQTWRDHFPDHRILVVSFQDVSLGKRQIYNDLTEFLCVRRYPEDILSQFEAEGSTQSFGQQAAEKGLEQAGFDTYTGNDRYLANMLPSTREALLKFYAPANKKLASLLGAHYVYWAS